MRTERKRLIFAGTFLLAVFTILFVTQSFFVSAATTNQGQTYCAQQTKNLAGVGVLYCQNVPLNQVDTNYNYAPTSCDQTSFCKTGTCVNTQNGLCSTSPSVTCKSGDGGVWYDSSIQDTPQCQQGCCLIGDQASFTTQAHCNALGSKYGLNINFRSDITDQITCLESAYPQAQGACVYETSAGRTCKFTTHQDCQSLNGGSTTFHQGFLCSNPDLGTNCVKTNQTTCLNGQDQVYFVDSCGNPANVYDASKANNITYWSYMPGIHGVTVESIATVGSGGDATVNGNCDYYSGSTCMPYNKSIDTAINPSKLIGNYVCRDLNCDAGPFVSDFENQLSSGRAPVNGETWCGTLQNGKLTLGNNTGLTGTTAATLSKADDLPGSRDYRFLCYNGHVTVEACGDYRSQICQEGVVNGVYSGNCILNRWQDCYSQTSKTDCLNTDQRDCVWVTGISIIKDSNGTGEVWDPTKDKLVPMVDAKGAGTLANSPDNRDDRGFQPAACVPKYPPGFDPSSSVSSSGGTDAQTVCSIASTNCYVQFERGALASLGGGGNDTWTVLNEYGGVGNIHGNQYKQVITCLNDNGTIVNNWLQNYTNLCYSLGDCGVSANYAGTQGLNTKEGSYMIVGNFSSQTVPTAPNSS